MIKPKQPQHQISKTFRKFHPSRFKRGNMQHKLKGESPMKIFTLVFMGFLSLIALVSPVTGHAGEDNFTHHSMMGSSFGQMNFFWVFGWIFMILILVILILFIILIAKQIQNPRKK